MYHLYFTGDWCGPLCFARVFPRKHSSCSCDSSSWLVVEIARMFVVHRHVGRCSVNAPCQDGRSPLHCAVAEIDSCGPMAVRLLSLGWKKWSNWKKKGYPLSPWISIFMDYPPQVVTRDMDFCRLQKKGGKSAECRKVCTGVCNQHAAEALFSSRSEATRSRWPNTSRLLEKPGRQRNLTKFNITSWLTPKQNPAPQRPTQKQHQKHVPVFFGKTTAFTNARPAEIWSRSCLTSWKVQLNRRCLDVFTAKIG